ncbi:MAG: gamma-glutamyl-phosphate reductase, partial [Clostridia bacterium]|nr:gamma-glutamyl-phosphate reductase [Clostridia bacterium]
MLQELIYAQGKKARRAARVLANLSSDKKNQVLLAIADSLETKQDRILAANEQDLASGREKGLSKALLD